MNMVEKIDKFLDKMDSKKKKMKKNDKLSFLYTKEDLDGIVDSKTMESLLEKRKVGGHEYDKFFMEMLKKWKIKSYKDLPKNKQQAFFDAIEKGWNAKDEKGKDGRK